jgi:hypothetical protein
VTGVAVQHVLDQLNRHLAELYGTDGLKLAIVPQEDLEFVLVNARYMEQPVYAQLVANIKQDRYLSSVPFCWFNPETQKYLVLSGNHRVKAGIDAGLSSFLVLFIDRPLQHKNRLLFN